MMTTAHLTTPAKVGVPTNPLSAEEQRKLDAYWRAANYLSVCGLEMRTSFLHPQKSTW
jgi:phosphoketolase